MTDAPGHLDLDALADVLAGERDDAHLAACATCSARLAELADASAAVTAHLAALPPPPLPDGLAARLDRALEQERRREVAAVRPLRRRPAAAWLPSVAASVALVLVGAVGWSVLGSTGPQSADTASEAGSDAGGGGGGEGGVEEDASAAAPGATMDLAVPRARTGTDWADPAARPSALARLLDATDSAAGAMLALPPGDPALDRLRDPAALSACVNALAGDAEVLAVDEAQYAGVPAVAVVQAAGPGTVRVAVVGSGCTAADPALLSEVVLPRP